MGLLTQAFAGGLSGLGQATAEIATDNMKATHQAEHDAAMARKEASLAELRHRLVQDDANSNYFNPDSGARLTNKEVAEYDKDSLIGEETAKERFKVDPDIKLNGRPATRAQIDDNAEANATTSEIGSDQDARAFEEAKRQLSASGPGKANMGLIGSAQQATPEEKEILDSWKGDTGKIESTKHELAQLKADADKEKRALQVEHWEKEQALKEKLQTERLDAATKRLEDAKKNGDSLSIRQATLDLAKQREERMNDQAADKILAKYNGDPSRMSPEDAKKYNRYTNRGAAPDSGVSVPAMTKAEATAKAKQDAIDAKETEGWIIKTPKKEDVERRTKDYIDGKPAPAKAAAFDVNTVKQSTNTLSKQAYAQINKINSGVGTTAQKAAAVQKVMDRLGQMSGGV